MRPVDHVPIKDLVVKGANTAARQRDEMIWSLNLDQIKSGTGHIISKLRIPAKELGSSTHYFTPGTVLYSKLRPYLNKVVVADEPGFATTELVSLRCDQEKITPEYLCHYLRSPKFVAFASATVAGAKMPRMVMTEFWNHKVPTPLISEQRRITAILDKAESLQSKREKAIAQLDMLAQAIFIEMFGDPIENDRNWTMGPVSDFVSGFEAGKNLMASEDESSSKFRVLKISAITSLEYQPEQSKPLPSEYQPPVSHFVHPGDLLFSRANTKELIGATAYVDETPKNIVLPDKLWRFSWFNPPRAELFYVRHLFRQPRFREEIGRRATGTSGSMQNISQGKVLSITVGQPTLTLQKQFAERIKIIEAVKRKHRTAMAEFGNLFSALQTRAFQGEL